MYYQSTPIEQALLRQSTISEQSAYLHPNLHTKIQEIECDNRRYYSSYKDQDQFVRLLIFSFLSKVYRKYTPQNQLKLNAFKEAVYSSELKQLTQVYNTAVERLRKLFAEAFQNLPIGDNSDEMVAKMMNCEEVVEQIMATAVNETVYKFGSAPHEGRQAATSKCEQSIQWLFNLGFTVKITNQSITEEKDEEIFIYSNGNSCFREAYRQELPLDLELQSMPSFPKLEEEMQGLNERMHQQQESIAITDRSYIPSVFQKSKSESFHNFCKQEQMISSEWKNCGIDKKKAQERSFFDIFFCCSTE